MDWKITQISEIGKFGVMFTPAHAVDGVVRKNVTGKVPDVEQIKWLIP